MNANNAERASPVLYPELERLLAEIRTVAGIRAIVIGGSRANGTAGPDSDWDIGLYCRGTPDTAHLQRIVSAFDPPPPAPRNAVTKPGEWGPWINGGGWLKIAGQPVDLLYRDIEAVEAVLADCLGGRVTIDNCPGHPHGFANTIWLAELASCVPVWDADGWVAAQKRRLTPYPEAMRLAILGKYGWEAGFAAETAAKGIPKGDVGYVAGGLFRSVSCLHQAVFALNRAHLMNEKGAARLAESLPVHPANYAERVNRVFVGLDGTEAGMRRAVDETLALVSETRRLMDETP